MTHRVISTILRFDAKQTSYRIAQLRALIDAVLAYPDLRFDGRDVAVPLRTALAQPIRYAGPGRWSVVAKPAAPGALEGVAAVPGARRRRLR